MEAPLYQARSGARKGSAAKALLFARHGGPRPATRPIRPQLPGPYRGHQEPRLTRGAQVPEIVIVLDKDEAAARLRVSERTVRRYITAGLLDGVRAEGPRAARAA